MARFRNACKDIFFYALIVAFGYYGCSAVDKGFDSIGKSHPVAGTAYSVVTGVFAFVIMCIFLLQMFAFSVLFVMKITNRVVRDGYWSKSMLQSIDEAAADDSSYEFLCYRYAKLAKTDSGLSFCSMTRDVFFSVEQEAVCRFGHDHAVPDKDCTCGWYSLHTAASLDEVRFQNGNRLHVVLQCSYSGTVIPAKKGIRAAKQHVLKAFVPATCEVRGCTQSSQSVCIANDTHKKLFGKGQPDPTMIFCETHQPEEWDIYSVVDLRNALGCEVVFV